MDNEAKTYNNHSQTDTRVCLRSDRREKRKDEEFNQLTPSFIAYAKLIFFVDRPAFGGFPS
jgi:hypothetical protein